jgi:polysaccharide biosynthesis protein PslG
MPSNNLTPQRRTWLPYAVGGGIAIALLLAIAFVGYAFFIYEPQPPDLPAEPTATVQVVIFDREGGPETAVANPPSATPPPPQPTATPAPTGTNPEPTPTATGLVEPTATRLPPAPTPRDSPAAMSSPDYGMQVFLFWREEIADRDLGLVRDAGFHWVKQEFAWREIEGAGKGVFDWTNPDRVIDEVDAFGLNIIARIGVQPQWATPALPLPEVGPPQNYQDFADFIFAIASRYRGRIDAYQIWNEPNLAREWGNRPPNPQEYTQLLCLAYNAVKRADPNAAVISAGLAPTTRWDAVAVPDTVFIQGLYDAGAKPCFDFLGAHGAGYKSPPETDPAVIAADPNLSNPGDHAGGVPEELRRVYGFRHVEDVRQVMVRNGDADKRVVLLEFGWTIDPRPDSPYFWHRVTDIEQADYLVRAYQYARQNWQPWIAVMSLIYVANPEWTLDDEQTYWSIVYPKYPETLLAPAYHALKAMPK